MYTERQILEQLIKDGKDAERKLQELEVTYSVGDRFKNGEKKYLLTCAPMGVALVCLEHGGVYGGKSVNVENIKKITQMEFEDVAHDCASYFIRYWDSRKQVKT